MDNEYLSHQDCVDNIILTFAILADLETQYPVFMYIWTQTYIYHKPISIAFTPTTVG